MTTRPKTRKPQPQPGHLPSAYTPPLLIFSLGQARVELGGVPVSWGARSAEELFWYLHAHPAGVSRQQILSELWNLEDTPAAANRFRVALFRVRSALGSPEMVTEQGGRFALGTAVFAASDGAALERALQDASSLPERRAQLELLQAVRARCGGLYLPPFQESWAQAERERWRAVQVALEMQVARLQCLERQCEQSACTLRAALSNDPYQPENLHQRLMGCLNVTENKYVAIEYYRRYLRFLSEEVGDTPMPETVELAQAIKLGDYVCEESGLSMGNISAQEGRE